MRPQQVTLEQRHGSSPQEHVGRGRGRGTTSSSHTPNGATAKRAQMAELIAQIECLTIIGYTVATYVSTAAVLQETGWLTFRFGIGHDVSTIPTVAALHTCRILHISVVDAGYKVQDPTPDTYLLIGPFLPGNKLKETRHWSPRVHNKFDGQ
jgi:hypothetical protein